MSRFFLSAALLAAIATTPYATPAYATEHVAGGPYPAPATQHGGPIGGPADDVSPATRRSIDEAIARHRSTSSITRGTPVETPAPYLIHPQAGNVNGDLWPNSFVDLDPSSPGFYDFDCTDITYDTHAGHDTDLRTFTEQAIGVPVLAALDGTVMAIHDGEEDMQLGCATEANYVILDHGGTHYSLYLHLRKDSIPVMVGQFVYAGTQIGLTGSSGCSFYPHLHFESQINGQVYEPNAGPCREGESNWVDQIPVDRHTYATDFAMTTDDLTYPNWQGFPYDTSRTGTFPLSDDSVLKRFWIVIRSFPVDATWRTRFQRPDGTFALDETGPFDANGNPAYRWASWWQQWGVPLDQVGTWKLVYDVNGENMVDAPFDVVATAGDIVNRPPNDIGVVFDPPVPAEGKVVFCRVVTSLILDDPDYDVVRYRYQWTVNGSSARDVTHAGQADALARNALTAGDEVVCTVTPSDGQMDGNPAQTSATVAAPCMPGDCNVTGAIDAGDPICAVLCLVGQQPAGADCQCAADCNCSAGIEAADPVCTVLRLIDDFTPDTCQAP